MQKSGFKNKDFLGFIITDRLLMSKYKDFYNPRNYTSLVTKLVLTGLKSTIIYNLLIIEYYFGDTIKECRLKSKTI